MKTLIGFFHKIQKHYLCSFYNEFEHEAFPPYC
jgi:hypothetical protein